MACGKKIGNYIDTRVLVTVYRDRHDTKPLPLNVILYCAGYCFTSHSFGKIISHLGNMEVLLTDLTVRSTFFNEHAFLWDWFFAYAKN